MNWDRATIKKRAKGLPYKFYVRVLTVLNTKGERAAQTEFLRAWKFVNGNEGGDGIRDFGVLHRSLDVAGSNPAVPVGESRERPQRIVGRGAPHSRFPSYSPSHPSISRGDCRQDLGGSAQVAALTSKGFSVGKIVKELGLSRRSVLAIRARLHKKQATVPLCTTLTVTEAQHTQPQVHRFHVEVALPWEEGTREWRESLKKECVQGYKVNKEVVSGYQEHYELTPQVSVRTTKNKIFLTVKNVWGKNFDECEKSAWDLVQDACVRLETAYGFEFGEKIQVRFKGAEWALVNHEVAKVCHKVGIKPVTFQYGKKVMQVDITPDKCVEFNKKEHGEIAYENQKDVVLNGLTQRMLANTLNEFMTTVKMFIEVQTQTLQARSMPEKIDENIIPKERPDYFG